MTIAPINLSDLLSPRSPQTILNDFYSFLANPPDPSLVSVRTANWRTGGPYGFLANRMSLEGSNLYQVIAAFAGSAFLRYASGSWLDWLGQDFFSEPRQQATFSSVTETVTIPPGAGPYGPLQLTVATTDGKQFASTSLVTIPANATLSPITIDVPMVATQAGALYNVGPNTLTQLISPQILGLSVSNAAASTIAFDMEPDSRYRLRLAAKWGAITGSTAAAYVFWAMTASPEVIKVAVNANQRGGVFVQNATAVVIGTAIGPVSMAAHAAVLAYISPLIALNSTLEIVDAVAMPVVLQGTVSVYKAFAGQSPAYAPAYANIANSLQALAALVPIGGYQISGGGPVPVSEFARACAYDPTQVYDVNLTAPAAPVAPAYNQLIVPSGTLLGGLAINPV